MSALGAAFELSVVISAIDKFTSPMKKAQESMKYTQKDMDMITKSMKTMGASSKDIDKMTSSMNNMAKNKAWSNLAKDMKAAGVEQHVIDEYAKGFDKLAEKQEKLDKMTASFKKFTGVMAAGAGVTAVGFKMAEGIVHAADEAGKLLTVLTTIRDATGANDNQMESIRSKITQTSAVTKFGIMDTAHIASILATSGYDPEQTKDLLPVFTKLAEVQQYGKGSSPEETVKQAIELGHGFGHYDPASLNTFLDSYNKATFLQPEDSTKYGETLKYLMSTGGTLGMNDSDIMYMAALSNRMGLAGSMGGTNAADMLMRAIPGISGGLNQKKDGTFPKQLQTMMKLGLADSKGNSPFFDNSGSIKNLAGFIDTLYTHTKDLSPKDKLQDLHDIFGIQGARVAALFASPQAQEQLKALHEGNGRMKSIDQFQEDYLKTPEGQMNQFASNLNNLKFSVFLAMAKALNPLLEKLNDLLAKIIEFSDAHPKIAQFVATFALIAAGAFLVIGPIIAAVGAIAMMTLAVGALEIELAPIIAIVLAVVAALALLAWGAYEVYKHWDQIKAYMKPVVDWMVEKMKPLVVDVVETVKGAFKRLQETAGPIWDQLKTDMIAFWNWAGPYITFYGKWYVDTMKLWFEATIPVVKYVFDFIIGIVKIGFDIMSNTILVILDMLHGDFRKAWSDYKDGWARMSTDTQDTMTTLGGDLKNIVSTWGSALAEYGVSIAKDFGTSFGQEMKAQVWTALQNTKFLGKNMLDMLPDSVKEAIKPDMNSGPSASKMGPVAMHASGGIFDQPHFGVFGEAGAEAFIPLRDRTRGLQVWQQAGAALGVDMLGSRGGGGDTHFHIYQQPGQSAEELAEIVMRKLGSQNRSGIRGAGMRVNVGAI